MCFASLFSITAPPRSQRPGLMAPWFSFLPLPYFLPFILVSLSAKDGKELVSPCLSPGFKGEWEHAEITYRILGLKAGAWVAACPWPARVGTAARTCRSEPQAGAAACCLPPQASGSHRLALSAWHCRAHSHSRDVVGGWPGQAQAVRALLLPAQLLCSSYAHSWWRVKMWSPGWSRSTGGVYLWGPGGSPWPMAKAEVWQCHVRGVRGALDLRCCLEEGACG